MTTTLGNGSKVAGLQSIAVHPIIEMAAFDMLPFPLRRALDFHPFQLSAIPVLALWTDARLVEQLDSFERLEFILDDLARAARLAA